MLFLVFAVLCSLYDTSQAEDSKCYQHNPLVNTMKCTWTTHARFCSVQVNCRITVTQELAHLVTRPQVVKTLNISRNNLVTIKENTFAPFEELENLDLSFNNIQKLSKDAFSGLVNLRVLNLSCNALLNWDTSDIASTLPSLSVLDVTSSPVSWPAQDIARLPNITLFRGVVSFAMPYYLSAWVCTYCSITKDNRTRKFQDFYAQHKSCYLDLYNLHGSNFSSAWKAHFSITCHTLPDFHDMCKHTQGLNRTYPAYQSFSFKKTDVCLREITKWTTGFIPLGTVAMAINVVVMGTVASSESLRSNVAMFLISNMAMGDFAQGLFLVGLSLTRHVSSADEFFEMILSTNVVCRSILTVFIIAQSLGVLVGFLVVLERYLCIVYSMNPDIRITKTIAIRLMISVWLLTTFAVSLPFIFDMRLTMDDYSCVNVRTPGTQTRLPEYLGMVGVGFYGLIFILYAHIFYTVRKSSLNMGIQRDGKLAKRIMLVISSNLLFFLAPTMVIFLFVNYRTVNSRVVLFTVWNTVAFYCLGVNSCVNPLLYAFRNETFQSQLKKLLRTRQNVQAVVPAK